MAAPSTLVARARTDTQVLLTKLRNVLQIRADVTTQGGEAYVVPILDGAPDPVPELSAAQLISAMQALQAVNNALTANSETHRKSLLSLALSANDAVSNSRTYIREFRNALRDFRQLQSDLTDAANGSTILAYLTPDVGATVAQQVVDALAALTEIDSTLNAGAGTRRKDLNRASD